MPETAKPCFMLEKLYESEVRFVPYEKSEKINLMGLPIEMRSAVNAAKRGAGFQPHSRSMREGKSEGKEMSL
jgi:hypothetical protein